MNRCDPDTPAWMCLTPTEMQWGLGVILVIGFAFYVRAVVRAENRKRFAPKQNRGVDPSQGSTVSIQNQWYSDETGGHLSTSIHTKNPQAHAKAFIPNKASKKDAR